MSSSPSAPPPANDEPTRRRYAEWVLLDTAANRQKNYALALPSTATTASAFVKSKNEMGEIVDVEVEVSFWLLNPPEVSSFEVHCRGLRVDGLPSYACIVSAEGDVVLLYVILDKYQPGLYFVYRAGHGNKLLDVLLCPSRPFDRVQSVGILPHSPGSREGYVVATIIPTFIDGVLKYQVFRYSSKTKAWSTKVAPLISDYLRDILNHSTDKVIAVGDSMGWVDLWWGILVCNVLNEEDPVVRFIELPDPMPHNEHLFATSSAESCRDVICIGDLIKFIEVDYYHQDDCVASSDLMSVNFGWKATAWQKVLSSYDFADWRECFTVDTDDMTIADERYSYILPELWSDKAKKLSLDKLRCSCPTLSMDADVFYMKSLRNPTNPVAWLAAVNMKENSLKLVSFNVEGFHWNPTYCPFAFSTYLNFTPGEHVTVVTYPGRFRSLTKGLRLSTLLSVEKWLKEHEEYIQRLERPSSWTACNLLSSDLASIQQCLVSCRRANSTGSVAVDMLIRALGDIIAMFPVDVTSNNDPTMSVLNLGIKMALDLTDRLLQDFPPFKVDKARAHCVQDKRVPTPSFSRSFKLVPK